VTISKGWPYGTRVADAGGRRARGLGLTLTQRVDLLAAVPLFEGLSKRQLRGIAHVAIADSWSAGSRIMAEGSQAKFCCVLVEGRVEVVKGGHRVAQLGPGDIVGEVALLDPGPRTATVMAVTDVTAVRLARTAFVEVVTEDPRILLRILQTMAHRLRDATDAMMT
jgi:CRP-like cAMP-binding protein